MSRNANALFATAPTVNISRSKFNMDHEHTTSFNVGELIPIFVEKDVLPGDSFSLREDCAIRLIPMVAPVYDNLFLDTYYFFVPYRLVWSHTKEFFGENTQSAWYPEAEYTIPQIEAPEGGWNVGTLADYLGIPTGVGGISVGALTARAYALICNEWFRNQQLQDPLAIPVGDSTVTGVNTGDQVTDVAKLGKPFIAGKYQDYFVSCSVAPQYGPSVQIPLTDNGNFPVVPMAGKNVFTDLGKSPTNFGYSEYVLRASGAKPTYEGFNQAPYEIETGTGYGLIDLTSGLTTGEHPAVVPSNLYAVNSGQLVGATINSLRQAFQIQKFMERQAIAGSRYTEIIRSMFGVVSPDSRLQRPEYLGGRHTVLNISSVIQASQTTETSPQGNVSGLSFTTDTNHCFERSFTEHGIILGLACVRYHHKYQQGLDRSWSRKDKWDFYWPLFANLGSQSVLRKELYATGVEADDNQVFGYQERYAEYRFRNSYVTGQMRSAASGSLDAWHFADDYATTPYLSADWIMEDKSNVDRALAIQSSNTNQILADFWFVDRATRPMPVRSIPGLIDHH